MKRFVIVPKRVGEYCIPVIEIRTFNSPKWLGAYCADNGSLWPTLDDGKNIFENESDAIKELQKLRESLYSI